MLSAESISDALQRGEHELINLLAHFSGAIEEYMDNGDESYIPDLMADIVTRFPSVVSYIRLLPLVTRDQRTLILALNDLEVLNEKFKTVCDMGFGFQELYNAIEWIESSDDVREIRNLIE